MSSFADRYPPGSDGYRPALDGGADSPAPKQPRRLRWADLTSNQRGAIELWVKTDCHDGARLLSQLLAQEELDTGSDKHRALAEVRHDLQEGILSLLLTTLSSLDLDMIGRVMDEGFQRDIAPEPESAESAPPAAGSSPEPVLVGGTAPKRGLQTWADWCAFPAPQPVTPSSSVKVTAGYDEPHPYSTSSLALRTPYRIIGYFQGKASLLCGLHNEQEARAAFSKCASDRPDLCWTLCQRQHDVAGVQMVGYDLLVRSDGASGLRSRFEHAVGGDVFLGQADDYDVYARPSQKETFALRSGTGNGGVCTVTAMMGDNVWPSRTAARGLAVGHLERRATPPATPSSPATSPPPTAVRWKRHAIGDYFLGRSDGVDWYLRKRVGGSPQMIKQYDDYESSVTNVGASDVGAASRHEPRHCGDGPFHPAFGTKLYLGSLVAPLVTSGPSLSLDVYFDDDTNTIYRVFSAGGVNAYYDWINRAHVASSVPEDFLLFLRECGVPTAAPAPNPIVHAPPRAAPRGNVGPFYPIPNRPGLPGPRRYLGSLAGVADDIGLGTADIDVYIVDCADGDRNYGEDAHYSAIERVIGPDLNGTDVIRESLESVRRCESGFSLRFIQLLRQYGLL